MMRPLSLIMVAALMLTACAPSGPTVISANNSADAPKVYRIRGNSNSKLQFRMLDAVNSIRGSQGLAGVELNPQLNAAAATHSRDMSVQNRPWHFGSDGSSPIDRLARVGYQGSLVGENIAETYETELETLGAWMEQPDTRRTLLSTDAKEMGFAWFQEKNGKIWWTLVMGNPNAQPNIPSANPAASRLVPGPVVNLGDAATEEAEDDAPTTTIPET